MNNVFINNKEKYVVYEYQGTRFMSSYTEDLFINLNDNIKVIAENISQPVAYAIIYGNPEKNVEAFLNNIPKELRDDILKKSQNDNERQV